MQSRCRSVHRRPVARAWAWTSHVACRGGGGWGGGRGFSPFFFDGTPYNASREIGIKTLATPPLPPLPSCPHHGLLPGRGAEARPRRSSATGRPLLIPMGHWLQLVPCHPRDRHHHRADRRRERHPRRVGRCDDYHLHRDCRHPRVDGALPPLRLYFLRSFFLGAGGRGT